MAISDVLLGTDQTLEFGTFITKIISINWAGASREMIDTTVRGTAAYRTRQPGSYVDPGTMTFEMQYNGVTVPPLTGAIASVTVTVGDGTSSVTLVGDGFLTTFEFGSPDQDQLTATGTIAWTGTVTVAAA